MRTQLSLTFTLLLLLVVVATPALARDNMMQFSAQDAISSELGQDKLTDDVKLYMKGQEHPKALKKLGSFKSNKRTNSLGKSAEAACQRAFISALMALQSRAQREGGNAVVDIYSITKNENVESATEFSCNKGSFATNVVLKGTVVEFAK